MFYDRHLGHFKTDINFFSYICVVLVVICNFLIFLGLKSTFINIFPKFLRKWVSHTLITQNWHPTCHMKKITFFTLWCPMRSSRVPISEKSENVGLGFSVTRGRRLTKFWFWGPLIYTFKWYSFHENLR